MTTHQDTIRTLQQATKALAGVCDGARSDDGSGFNGVDASFGHSIAAKDRWTPKMVVAAQKMLRKYSNQLLGFGIDLRALPQLELEALMAEQPQQAPAAKLPGQVMLSSCGQYVEFYFAYNYEEKEYVKLTLKARFVNGQAKYWRLPLRDASIDALMEYGQRFGAVVDGKVLTAVQSWHAQSETAKTLSTAVDADISHLNLDGFNINLFPFQRGGVAYMAAKGKALNGDDMGLGKTYQGLGAVAAVGAKDRFIVVCPATVKIQWQQEVAKAFGSAVTSSIWEGIGKNPGSSDVNCIVINWDILAKHAAKLKEFRPKAIIFDECHYMKNEYKTARTDAAKEIAKGVPYLFPLSGTPMTNRPEELISILRMMGYLDTHFGGWYAFVSRYCQAHKKIIWVRDKRTGRKYQKSIWDTSGAANLQELNAKLRECCMVRRKKTEVLTELPPKQRAQVVLEIDNREEYEAAEANLLDYVRACAAADAAFLETIKHLPEDERKEAIREHQSDAAKRAEQAEQLVFMETASQIAARGILAGTIDWVNNFLETGEKYVIFAIHQEIQRALLKAWPQAARIVSEDSHEERQRQKERFMQDPACNVIVCSLGAGGTGVDGLQHAASNVGFVEFGWTPAVMLQAEDRLNRIGQPSSVGVTYFVAKDTIAETKQQMLAKKQADCDSALDGAPEVANGSVFNELLDALLVYPTRKRRKARKGAANAKQVLFS